MSPLPSYHAHHLLQLRKLKRDTYGKIYGHANRDSHYKLEINVGDENCKQINQASHGKRSEEHWREISHLTYESDTYEFASVIGVDYQAHDGGEYHTPTHGKHANGYGDTHHEGQQYFLDDLKAKEEIGTSLYL